MFCDFTFLNEINPLDESILPLINKDIKNFIDCPRNNDGMGAESYLDIETGTVHISTVKKKGLVCYYSTFERNGDDAISHSKEVELLPVNSDDSEKNEYKLNMIELNVDFVEISCKPSAKLGSIIQSIFRSAAFKKSYSFPSRAFYKSRNMQNDDKKLLPKDDEDRYSVFILVIESMSRINFDRWLTLTKEAIDGISSSKKSSFYNLKGLTKHADNSFPNLVTLLTGKSSQSIDPQISEAGPYDSLDLIWKKFQASGYKTSFLEEIPKFTLFNYYSKGFVDEPTDYYVRPFWVQTDKKFLFNKDIFADVCYAEEAKFDILLRQAKSFLIHGNKNQRPTFTFLMNIGVNHQDFNELKMLDTHLSNFILNFDNYHNTIFMIMGDHGNRFGPLVETEIGSIEERMPFFGLFLPPSLTIKQPSIAKNLLKNEYRLTSWFDINLMLHDILQKNFSEITHKQHSQSAFSPWREEIPLSRTCQEANIPDTYCVCIQFKEGNWNEETNHKIGQQLLNHINFKIKPFRQSCVSYRLGQVRSVMASSGQGKYLKVTISVEPSNGIFRATFYRSATGLELRGDITRLDSYGNQSHCLSNRSLKPYCLCK